MAVLFGLRANPAAGLTVLISSEVNKFTLLVGSTVGVFSISVGQLTGFPLDYRQAVEFLLTASVSLFALVLIARQRLDWRAGAILLGLFIVHLSSRRRNSDFGWHADTWDWPWCCACWIGAGSYG